MLTPNQISKMVVNDLKKELKDRGASTAGKKAELCARLLEMINEESREEDASDTAVVEEPITQNEEDAGGKEAEAVAPPVRNSTELVKNEASKERLAEEPIAEEPIAKEQPIAKEESAATETEESNTASATIIENTEEAVSTENTENTINKEVSLKEALKSKLKKINVTDSSSTSSSGATAEAIEATDKTEKAQSCFIRIDNFQRPLNLRSLIKFVEDALGSDFPSKIGEQKVWINSIKTHCYIDFDTPDHAAQCIASVTGKRFPQSNATALRAYSTSISAADAPSSAEAALLPGNWSALLPSSKSPRVLSPPAGGPTSAPSSGDRGAGASASCVVTVTGNKRKLVESSDLGGETLIKRGTPPKHPHYTPYIPPYTPYTHPTHPL